MGKPRTRYVAGIIYEGESPNDNEYELFSLKGVLYEEALEQFEACKQQLKSSGRIGKPAMFALTDMKLSTR